MPINRDASFLDTMPANVAIQFLDRVKQSGPREAFRFPAGDGWESVTWAEAGDRVRKLAAGLISLGIEPEQRVGILSGTRYEWILADLAIMCAGAATTTVYPSTGGEDTAYILADSGSRLLFAEDEGQIAKVNEHRGDMPELGTIVTLTGTASEGVLTLADLERLGEEYLAKHPTVIDDHAAAIPADQLATLIYTSGTTGKPKGVRLRHKSWVFEGEAIKSQGILGEDDLQFLWLPMAHSFGKVLLSTQLACGFATAIDGRVDKIVDNLAVIQPTFMGAAPRIFEKAYGRIITMVESEGKKGIFDKAFATGLEVKKLQAAGKPIPLPLKLKFALFDKLVFSKVRARFGGRIKFFISGSAALNREIAEWFNAAGLVILEGYGLTETSAGAFVNHPEQNKIGTVGIPFPGSEVRIAADGEVLIKGPNVMEGYHNLPDATAETLVDGWLHTGDIGELDADGHLRITDRKKDLFKTSGGKYVAPSSIESQFKAICPFVANMLVHGNERNFVSALITLDPDLIADWAKEHGLAGKSYAEIVTSDACQKMVQGYVDELNGRLNRWETIKKFVILDRDFSIEGGELTPSLKVKRKVVETNNKELIDSLYQG
ncbi:AMP-dependent synthetase/ligase [Nocardioides jiangxiensis]|uniref:AMP-dependent synthetase/ligase n=1 Tax=Nocardioides jiangxiensis TaxID=3064524 RepID=A0ABT9AXC7_9ACTN|nr:AMP-dependent synthetase/ligase [Nocardioides sp. WY-20]MDO7867191.1 AMP-dependent synthetase/ligase [Nocardioides sp. WY-20]